MPRTPRTFRSAPGPSSRSKTPSSWRNVSPTRPGRSRFTMCWRNITLANRIVVSPMDMYSAIDGVAGDFHLVHLGARALGGAALVFTEMTCVTAQGRISPADAGLYTDEHMRAWRRIA